MLRVIQQPGRCLVLTAPALASNFAVDFGKRLFDLLRIITRILCGGTTDAALEFIWAGQTSVQCHV